MPAGRPRNAEPLSEEETIKLGQELVAWATYADTPKPKKTDKRVCMSSFYSLKKMILRKDWKTIVQRREFLPYYESAQAALAENINNDMVKEGYGNRYLRLVQRDLVEEENEHAKFMAQIKNLDPEAVETIINIVNYANQKNGKLEKCEKSSSLTNSSQEIIS